MSGAASRSGAQAAKRRRGTGRGVDKRESAPRPEARSHELQRAIGLATLIESAGDAVLGVAPDGTLTDWSAGAERLLGYTRAEAIGRHVKVLVPPHRMAQVKEIHKQVESGGRVEGIETERVTKDGRMLRVRLSIAPVRTEDGELLGAVGIMRDLTSQREAEAMLSATERRYHSVVEALNEGIVVQSRDGEVLAFNTSAERILGRPEAELRGEAAGQAVPGLLHEDGSPVSDDEHPTAVAMRSGKPQNGVVMGVEGPEGAIRWLSINSRPLCHAGEARPYAAVVSFTEITELRETLAELRTARLEDLERLALVGEYRDDDTNRHTERVAHTAGLLAHRLGLDAETIERLERAAPLHDVGKIGIPDSILLKPGKLTVQEFEVIKTHSVIGGRILCESHSPILRMAAEIAFTHHERWDGTGYPAGLEAEGIPITGRIVALADAFDAMSHARPYKDAFSVDHAVAEIRRCNGSQFDPRIVEAFMTLDHRALVSAT
jgi:putative two-component system response regulator